MDDSKITEFVSITGTDPTTAKALLEACNGNLELAINMHMENGAVNGAAASGAQGAPAGAAQGTSGGASRARKRTHADDDDEDEDSVRAAIPHKTETLLEPGYEDGYSQAQAAGNGRRLQRAGQQRVRTVFDGFRNFAKEAGTQYAGSSKDGSSSSQSKKASLEDLFKPPIDLIFKGDMKSAKDFAENAGKWLIVNIQDSREFACQMLNRDIWSQESVKSIVREHFIFWQQYKESEDAQRYMRFYPVTEWPHVAVLDPQTGEKMVTWNRIPDPNVFSDLVATFLSHHPSLEANNGAKNTSKTTVPDKDNILNADEDDQLAAAIKASLESAAGKKDSADSDSELEFEEDDSCQEWAKSGNNSSRAISPEPTKAKSTAPAANGKAPEPVSSDAWEKYLGSKDDPPTDIMIRFPDGAKETKTLPSTSQLKALVLYTESKGFPSDLHDIVMNFPRRVLTDGDDSKTLKDLDLCPRSAVFVQRKN